MDKYSGKTEDALRELLEDCTNFQERRKIRDAIRDIHQHRDNNTQTSNKNSDDHRHLNRPSRFSSSRTSPASDYPFPGLHPRTHHPPTLNGDGDPSKRVGGSVYRATPYSQPNPQARNLATTSRSSSSASPSSSTSSSRMASASLTSRPHVHSSSGSGGGGGPGGPGGTRRGSLGREGQSGAGLSSSTPSSVLLSDPARSGSTGRSGGSSLLGHPESRLGSASSSSTSFASSPSSYARVSSASSSSSSAFAPPTSLASSHSGRDPGSSRFVSASVYDDGHDGLHSSQRPPSPASHRHSNNGSNIFNSSSSKRPSSPYLHHPPQLHHSDARPLSPSPTSFSTGLHAQHHHHSDRSPSPSFQFGSHHHHGQQQPEAGSILKRNSVDSTSASEGSVLPAARIAVRRSSHVFLSDGQDHPHYHPNSHNDDDDNGNNHHSLHHNPVDVLHRRSPSPIVPPSPALSSPSWRERQDVSDRHHHDNDDSVFLPLDRPRMNSFGTGTVRSRVSAGGSGGGEGGRGSGWVGNSRSIGDGSFGGSAGGPMRGAADGKAAAMEGREDDGISVTTATAAAASYLPASGSSTGGSAVDRCDDEDELLDLLCTTEDIKERLKIRARLRHLKENRERQRGLASSSNGSSSHTVVTTTTSTTSTTRRGASPSLAASPGGLHSFPSALADLRPTSSSASSSLRNLSASASLSTSPAAHPPAAGRESGTFAPGGGQQALPPSSSATSTSASSATSPSGLPRPKSYSHWAVTGTPVSASREGEQVKGHTLSTGGGSGGDGVATSGVAAAGRGSEASDVGDYGHITDVEELRNLLNATHEFDEKRRIRNAMRQLRKNNELERARSNVTPLTIPAAEGSPSFQDDKEAARATRSAFTPARNRDGVKVGTGIGSSSSFAKVTKSQDRTDAAVAYAPYERRAPSDRKKEAETKEDLDQKVKAALADKLRALAATSPEPVSPIPTPTLTPSPSSPPTLTPTPADKKPSRPHSFSFPSRPEPRSDKDEQPPPVSRHDKPSRSWLQTDSEKKNQESRLSALVQEKVQTKLQTTHPERRDRSPPTEYREERKPGSKASQQSAEAEENALKSRLTGLVHGKVQAALDEKLEPSSKNRPLSSSSFSALRQEKASAGSAAHKTERSPIVAAVTISDTKRSFSTENKPWESTLRGPNVSKTPAFTTSTSSGKISEPFKSSSFVSTKGSQDLAKRRSSIGDVFTQVSDQAETKDVTDGLVGRPVSPFRRDRTPLKPPSSPLVSRSLHKDEDAAILAQQPSSPRRRLSVPFLSSNSPFQLDTGSADKRPTSPFQTIIGSPTDKRPASPFQSSVNVQNNRRNSSSSFLFEGSPLDKRSVSPFESITGSAADKRPASPLLSSQRNRRSSSSFLFEGSPFDKRSVSPFESITGSAADKRPASPLLSSQRNRRSSSPFLSEGIPLDKRPISPFQSTAGSTASQPPVRPQIKRPSSPFLSDGNRRPVSFFSPSPTNRESGSSLSSSEDRSTSKPVTSSFQPVVKEKENESRSAFSQPKNKAESTLSDQASEKKGKESYQTKLHADSKLVGPAAVTASAKQQESSDTGVLKVKKEPTKDIDSAYEKRKSAPVVRRESFDWDLLNKVKARLHSRTESLSSEEKYQEAVRSRSSLSSSSENLDDAGGKDVSTTSGSNTTGRKPAEASKLREQDTEKEKPADSARIPSKSDKSSSDQRREGELKYKDVREQIRHTSVGKDIPQSTKSTLADKSTAESREDIQPSSSASATDRSGRPVISKSLVSSLADKFAATASSQLNVFSVTPKDKPEERGRVGGLVRRAESFKVNQKAEDSDQGRQKSRLPRRSESLSARDSPRRPSVEEAATRETQGKVNFQGAQKNQETRGRQETREKPEPQKTLSAQGKPETEKTRERERNQKVQQPQTTKVAQRRGLSPARRGLSSSREPKTFETQSKDQVPSKDPPAIKGSLLPVTKSAAGSASKTSSPAQPSATATDRQSKKDEGKPAEIKAAEPKSPSSSKSTPQSQPVSLSKPAAKAEPTVSRDQASVTQKEAIINKDEVSFAEDQSIVSQSKATVAKDEAIVAKDEVSFAKDQTPVSQSQATVAKDEAIVAKDEVSFAKDQTPVSQSQATVAKDEAIVAKEEATVAKDQATAATKDEQQPSSTSAASSTSTSSQQQVTSKPKGVMEQAFSALLEDIETFSASEGTLSDLDFSSDSGDEAHVAEKPSHTLTPSASSTVPKKPSPLISSPKESNVSNGGSDVVGQDVVNGVAVSQDGKDDNSRESGMKDDNSRESSIKDDNARESGMKDDNSRESSIKDDNARESGIKDDNSRESSIKDDNSRESGIKEESSISSAESVTVPGVALKRSGSLSKGSTSSGVSLTPLEEEEVTTTATPGADAPLSPLAVLTKEDSGIGLGAGDLDDFGTVAPAEVASSSSKKSLLDIDTEFLTPTLPSLTDDEGLEPFNSEPLATLHEEDSAPSPTPPAIPVSPPPTLPSASDAAPDSAPDADSAPESTLFASADPDMTSSAFLTLKPVIDSVVEAQRDVTDGADSKRNVTIVEDDDGGVTYRKTSLNENRNRIVTIKSKVRRTPSNANEEVRDTIVETSFQSPGGAAVKERDVIRSKRKITSRGSNYYQRTTQHTRRVSDKEGSDFVEHDVCVERDNKSVTAGRSWGNRVVTKVTLDDPSGQLTPALDELSSLPQLEAAPAKKPVVASVARMDLSKASSGYGSVSGSEEEDKESTAAAASAEAKQIAKTAATGFRKRYKLRRQSVIRSADRGSSDSSGDEAPSPTRVRSPHRLRGRAFRFFGRRRAARGPEVLTMLKDVAATEGHDAVLECTLALGDPPGDIAWYFANDKLDTEQEHCSAHFDPATGRATLTLRDLMTQDEGEYTCVISNPLGEASTRTSLVVKPKPSGPPVFLEPLPTDVTVAEDHSVTLTCSVTSAEVVAWYKDGIVQRNSSDFRQTFDGCRARLEIGEVFLDDVGQYACAARNEVGEARTSCRLIVTASTSDTTVVPMFLTKLRDKTLNDGDPLLLECDIIGSPEPSIRWLRDGLDLPDTLSFSTSYDGRVAVLKVDSLALDEGGVFECVAENSAGKASMDMRVHVQKTNKPPTFTKTPQDVAVDAGKNVSLKCEVTGTPPPTVIWRRNGLIVADTPDFLQTLAQRGGGVAVARLDIRAVRDKHGGVYECVAKNDAGNAVCSCSLQVNTVSATSTTTAADKQQQPEETPPPPVTTRRSFKKLSEPQQKTDIISAVIKAGGVQRAQSFSPGSTTGRSSASSLSPRPSDPARAAAVGVAPEEGGSKMESSPRVSEVKNGDGGSVDGDKPVSRYTVQWSERRSEKKETRDVTRGKDRGVTEDATKVEVALKDRAGINNAEASAGDSSAGSEKEEKVAVKSERDAITRAAKKDVTSDSGKEVTTRAGKQGAAALSSETDTPAAANIRDVAVSGKKDISVTGKGDSAVSSKRDETVSSKGDVAVSGKKEKDDAPADTTRPASSASSGRSSFDASSTSTTTTTSCRSQGVPEASQPSSLPEEGAVPTSTQQQQQQKPEAQTDSTTYSRESSAPTVSASSPKPERKFSTELPKQQQQATAAASPTGSKVGQSPRSMVSQLRAQFTKMEEESTAAKGGAGGGAGGGVRRWHSMPLKHERPVVVKRGPSHLASEDKASSQSPATAATEVSRGADTSETAATMSSYDHITDEEELHKLMNSTESFDDRKKIRLRLREIRDKQREEMEARRREREKETEDLVRRKFQLAEEEKKRKMEAYRHQKPTCERDSEYTTTADKMVVDKHRQADEDKQKRLDAYKNIARKEHERDDGKTSVTTVTVTSKGPDGSTTTAKRMETTTSVKQTTGFGGVQYGATRPAESEDGLDEKKEVQVEDGEEDKTESKPDDKAGATTDPASAPEAASKENPGPATGTSDPGEEEDVADGVKKSDQKTEGKADEEKEGPPKATSHDEPSESSTPPKESPASSEGKEPLTKNDGMPSGEQAISSATEDRDTTPTKGEGAVSQTTSSEGPEKGVVTDKAATPTPPKVEAASTSSTATPAATATADSSTKPKSGPSVNPTTGIKKPELNTRSLKEQLSNASGPGSSGSITVKTESWSSRDGVVHKAQKAETWGAKPQGARGAMAAFKQMDAANPQAKGVNGLVSVSLAKKAAHTMRKNAVAIKQEVLRFVNSNVDDYENIAVTNFSSCWNNGLAFCALIHHFYPDAFDYSQLDAKNRRYNFDLAFQTAEKLADIAPLLDTDDMVKMKNPDWKCVFTYVQSMYRHLRDHENNKAKGSEKSEA